MTKLDNSTKIVDALKSWVSIMIIVGGAIVSCANAYYQLHEIERDLKEYKESTSARFKSAEERSDKRYDRAMEIAQKHEEFGMYHEKRILELEKENAYLKAKMESYDRR